MKHFKVKTSVAIFFTLASALFISFLLTGCSEKESAVLEAAQPAIYRAEVVNPDYLGGIVEPRTGAALVWGSDGSIKRSSDGGRSWVYSETPVSSALSRIAADDDGEVLIAVGAQGTLLRSSDQGQTWQLANSPASVDLKAVLYSPTKNSPAKNSPAQKIWFAAGVKGTLLSSTDDGRNWNQIELTRELSELDIESLFMIPESGRLLLGGTLGLLGFSDDGGVSWQLTQLDLDTPLSGFYSVENTLIATSAYGKFLLSRDNGDSWQLIETDGQAFFNDVVYDPEHKTIVMVSHNGKVLSSADAGASWQIVQTFFHGTSNYLASALFDAQQKKLRAFGHYGTQLISADGGRSWVAESAPNASITFENIVPLNDGKTYIGYGRGGFLASSFDKGKHWQAHLPQLDVYWREVLITPKGNWLVAGELGFILRSENQGKTWQLLDVAYKDPVTPPTYRALVIEPETQAIIATGPTGTIVRSADDGLTWTTVHYTPFADAEAFTDLIIDPQNKTLIAVEADGRHYFSTDAGLTWTGSSIASERKFWQGALLARAEQSVIIIAGQQGVLARSVNGGASWRFINAGTEADLFGSYADTLNQQFFLLGAEGVLLRSQDLGESWQLMTTGSRSDLRRMIADPTSGALMVFGGDGVILRSTDYGTTWQPMLSHVDGELRDAVIDPTSQTIFIAGRDGKIIRSRDAGTTWEILPAHTNTHFRSIALDPSTKTVIGVGERVVHLQR